MAITGGRRFDGRIWETLGERGNLLAGEGWRYARTGQARHRIVEAGSSTSEGGIARCGLAVAWYGTGCQAEYEQLARLPKCWRCEP